MTVDLPPPPIMVLVADNNAFVQRMLTKLGYRSRVGAAVMAHCAGLRWPPS